uniref:THAP-type domain-containing protein n=1 Tax=Amphimedon queenslandica TaxID=400682 RepID=A0A1X7U564_AMPQE
MPNRCVAYGCSNTCLEEGISVFHIPKNANIRKKWIQQVKRTRTGWKGPTGSSVVCSEHFSKILKGVTHSSRSVSKSSPEPPAEPIMIDCSSLTSELPYASTTKKSVSTQVEENKDKFCKGTQTERIICYNEVGIQCNLLPEFTLPQGTNELENDYSDDDDDESDICDDDNYLDEDSCCDSSLTNDEKQKYIVYEDALLSLFSKCYQCKSHDVSVTKLVIGSFLRIKQKCLSCETLTSWDSQPFVTNIPEGNLLISAAILFNGCLAQQGLRVFKTIGCACISSRSYFHHQRKYLHPAICQVWDMRQQSFFAELAEEGSALLLAGDGRADSPGHSAKYGSYSLVDLTHKVVLDIQLVQSNEVKSSNHMKLEGLKRAMEKIHDHDLSIGTIVTDRHMQISKWLRESHPDTKHYYDVWHVAKGVKKKLKALAKQKDCEKIGEWSKSIANHLYWCAASTTDGNQEMIKDKWLSLTNHIHNKHKHTGLYKRCSHGRLSNKKNKKWFKWHTKASTKVCDLLSNTRLCNQVKKLSPLHQTSAIEAFHSVIIQFAPKSRTFSFKGMLARLRLAALHCNENGNKEQSKTKARTRRYCISFPKYKQGGHVVCKLKVASTYGYVQDLLECTMQIVQGNKPDIFFEDNNYNLASPESLSQKLNHPHKSQAILEHKSRFSHTL